MPSAGTLASQRQAPQRRFENYILTRIVDSSVGLTSVTNPQFTQAPGPPPYGPDVDFNGAGAGGTDDATSSVTPIGFDFQIDGITYTHWVASCNGWMALVDPTTGTFDPNDVFFSSVWINEGIRPAFTSKAVLLAPWFDDLKNLLNKPSMLQTSPYNYSAAKVARIAAGLEPPPIYYNPTSYGISYYRDSQSPKGRRLIIRWASVSNYLTPQSVIRFEVVIYENGTIEYRYTPRQTIVNLPSEPNEGATIGIFMPNGTSRFRDFSAGLGYRDDAREENIYGGYTFDSTYFDGPFGEDADSGISANYTVSLQTTKHWPGLNNAGCIMRFSPPVNRRKVLPRKLVRGLDSRLSYPLVARTGDSRLGISLSAYDDRKSPNYIGLATSAPAATFGAQLDGLEWLLPRLSDNGSTSYTTLDSVTISELLSGDPNTIYGVTLRFRGVIEQKTYTGGTNDGAFFQTAGTPAGDSWNVYSLTVSDPPQIYYLNRGTSGMDLVNLIDYSATVPIRGNATVTLIAYSGGDHQEIANNGNTGGPLSVPAISDPAQPYLGQFILMNYLGSSVLSSSMPITITSKTQVNYPTTLPRFFGGTGLGTFERQDLMAGDFLVTGSVVKSAIDQYVGEAPIESIEAFNESGRHEQDAATVASSFYASGSSITYVSNGFDQSLKSKTQIKFSLPVSYGTPLPAATSSIYYYNQRIKTWEVPTNSTYVLSNGGSVPPSPNPSAGGDWGSATAGAVAGRLLEDARGFGPIGNIVSSGSNPLSSLNQSDVAINSSYDPTKIASIIGKVYPKSVRNNEEYRAAADETFTLPINAPFLIEKAVFEIPLRAGPGWFADQTQCFLPLGGPEDTSFDFAGPALTVALHRQVQLSENNPGPTVRDLILTGTITHQLDNVSQVVISKFLPYDATFQVRPVGFLAYANPPGAVVNPDGRQQFTGSVVVETTSLSTSGMLVKFVKDFTSGSAQQNSAGVSNLITKTPTLVLSDNPVAPQQFVKVAYPAPFGRAGLGFQQAGRCVLGNEFISFQGLDDQTGATAPNPFSEASLTTQQIAALASGSFVARAAAVIPLVSHFQSPYLVMPGDKLVLSISKMRPFTYNSTAAGAPAFSGSLLHDVVLAAGTINVTLYGSQIQAGVEFHDTMNQPLGSDLVHEIVGAEPVLDQFEVAYRNEFSGSFSDNVMLGTLGTTTFVSQSNGVTQAYLKLQTTRTRRVSRLGATQVPVVTADTRVNNLNAASIPSGLSPQPLPAIKTYVSIPAQLTTSSTDTSINPYKNFRLRPWLELNGAGTVRPTQFVDATERFWDSMMPSIANCFAADGAGIFISPAGTFGDFRQVDVAVTGSTAGGFNPNKGHNGWILFDNQNPSIMPTLGNIINGNWNKAFPFEPRYQSATRQLDIGKSFLATYIYQPGASPVVQSIPPTPVNGFFFGSVGLGTSVQNYSLEIQQIFGGPYILYFNNTPMYEWFADSNLSGKVPVPVGTTSPLMMPSTVYATSSLNVEDAARGLFGFGDRNTHYLSNGTLLGTNHLPDARDVEGPHPDSYYAYFDNSNFRFSPVIRGWKYGVASGLPLFSKAYWRKGRFGQFRDMLEQRPFTKYYQSPENSKNVPNFQQGIQPAAVTVTFLDPASSRLTAPDNTWSSNLHFECTSSLPFFDGTPTNRPAINPTILNLHPNVIRHDANGNIHIA